MSREAGATREGGPPSSNWLTLQKKMTKTKSSSVSKKTSHSAFAARKRRKIDHASESSGETVGARPSEEEYTFPRGIPSEEFSAVGMNEPIESGDSKAGLRRMVFGEVDHPTSHQQPGKYLALDCEMVGVGPDGSESALARVSIVNYYGHILLDTIVRPRERVVDYRTEFSGIRPSDMVNARPFEEVQKEVADLLKDRILVGHAVHNDLKALLLSHPHSQTRDTQILAHKHKVSRNRRPALRNLVQQELGLKIQGGEHSSVTDARATMALFCMHRKTWGQYARPLPNARSGGSSSAFPQKRPRTSSLDARSENEVESEDDLDDTATMHATKRKKKSKVESTFPGGGRKGVSSGLSTVVKSAGDTRSQTGTKARSVSKTKTQEKWWKELGGSRGSKGNMRLKVG